VIGGGLSTQDMGRNADSNFTTFEAHGSQFVDNGVEIPGLEPGGLLVFGTRAPFQPGIGSVNTVSVSLWGTKVSNNQGPKNLGINFQAFGALQDSLEGIAGTNNHVTIELHGMSKKLDVDPAMASRPEEPAGTNTVTVIQ